MGAFPFGRPSNFTGTTSAKEGIPGLFQIISRGRDI